MRGIGSSVLLFSAAWLPPARVGALSNTATRAIGPGPGTKAAAPAKVAAKVAAAPKKGAPKPEAKADPPEGGDAFAALTATLSAAGSLPRTPPAAETAAGKKPAAKKPAAKKPAAKVVTKKTASKVVAKKPAPKKVAAKKPAPKPKVVAKAKPQVKAVAKKKSNNFGSNINVANKLAKKSNKFDSNIANNLVKGTRKKKILTPLALKQPKPTKKPKAIAANEEVLNPITFGLKVIQSKGGQEAAGALIGGGLKLVSATLDEGKTAKVSVPRGLNPKTGEIKTEVVSVGPKELLDSGIFAGKEALQVAGSVYNKAYRGYTAPKSNSKKKVAKIRPADEGVLNPLTFGLKVVQSKEAQQATGELLGGGLKLVQATLEEGKRSKVAVPQRVDTRNGRVFTKATNIGPGELLQAGLFAGGEILEAGWSAYNRLYVTGQNVIEEKKDETAAQTAVATRARVSIIKANVDPKTRETLTPEKETYVVNVGGKKIRVVRDTGGLF